MGEAFGAEAGERAFDHHQLAGRRLMDEIGGGAADHQKPLPYERIFREWDELGYKPEIMEKIFHGNAERILGL